MANKRTQPEDEIFLLGDRCVQRLCFRFLGGVAAGGLLGLMLLSKWSSFSFRKSYFALLAPCCVCTRHRGVYFTYITQKSVLDLMVVIVL